MSDAPIAAQLELASEDGAESVTTRVAPTVKETLGQPGISPAITPVTLVEEFEVDPPCPDDEEGVADAGWDGLTVWPSDTQPRVEAASRISNLESYSRRPS